jgi:hypothetical protein
VCRNATRACRNHTCECQIHTHRKHILHVKSNSPCENLTMRAETNLLRVEFTHLRIKITLCVYKSHCAGENCIRCVEITLVHVDITLYKIKIYRVKSRKVHVNFTWATHKLLFQICCLHNFSKVTKNQETLSSDGIS